MWINEGFEPARIPFGMTFYQYLIMNASVLPCHAGCFEVIDNMNLGDEDTQKRSSRIRKRSQRTFGFVDVVAATPVVVRIDVESLLRSNNHVLYRG